MEAKKFDAEKLGRHLVEYGSLEKALEAINAKLASLKQQVEDLEERVKTLESDVRKLSEEKAALSTQVKDLESRKQALSRTVNSLQDQTERLRRSLPELKSSVENLQATKNRLQGEVAVLKKKDDELREKTVALPRIKEELERKAKLLQEVETKATSVEHKLKLLEGLMGFIGASTHADIEKSLTAVLELVAEGKTGKYEPEYLKWYILQELATDSFDVMTCTNCGIEFVVTGMVYWPRERLLGPSSFGNKYCPVCGSTFGVKVVKHFAGMLEKGLMRKAELGKTEPPKLPPEDIPA